MKWTCQGLRTQLLRLERAWVLSVVLTDMLIFSSSCPVSVSHYPTLPFPQSCCCPAELCTLTQGHTPSGWAPFNSRSPEPITHQMLNNGCWMRARILLPELKQRQSDILNALSLSIYLPVRSEDQVSSDTEGTLGMTRTTCVELLGVGSQSVPGPMRLKNPGEIT